MPGPTLIQIKRSLETAIPSSLANGELAITANGDVLYIGSNDVVVPIAGKRFPGVLTANQSVVTNATNMIDKIMFGNSTVNAVANSLALTISNSTVTFSIIKPTAAQVSSADYYFASDGAWKQVSGGPGATDLNGLTDVVISSASNNDFLVYDNDASVWENHAAGNGFVFSAQSPAVRAGTDGGLLVNTTGVWVVAGAGLLLNSTGVHVGTGVGLSVAADAVAVNPGFGIVANATGTWAKEANGITVDSSGINVLGGPTLTVNTTGAHVNSTLSITDLTLTGNLTVAGTLTTIDTTNLAVTDPLIKLANEQADTASFTDTMDVGMFGESGNTLQTIYHGLFRDATDGRWKLFTGEIPAPTTTVDTANVNFAYANLQINQLFLGTPLAASNGGTGRSTISDQQLLVGNTVNGFNLLNLGTTGKVLQSNGTAVIYDDLDGGTF